MSETDSRFKSVSHDVRWESFRWGRRRTNSPIWIAGAAPRNPNLPIWRAFQDRTTRWLLMNYLPGKEAYQPRDFYNPLETNPELFRTFASLRENDEADYAQFAETYGLLGIYTFITTPAENPRKAFGESLVAWSWNHRLMKALLCVYDAVRRSRANDLAQWLTVQPSEYAGWKMLSVEPSEGSPITLPRGGAWNVDALRMSDVLPVKASNQSERIKRIAMRWVANGVSLQLAGATFYESSVTAQVMRSTPNYDFGIQIMPTSLLGAMWLQFANTIEGNLNYHRCKNAGCRGWMLVSPGGKRAHADFCSDKCRLRHWRRRDRSKHRSKRR